MIFFGTRTSTLKTGTIRNITCTECDAETHADYAIMGKYAHIYWIPFFPISKRFHISCQNCGDAYITKQLPDNLRRKYDQNSANMPVRMPIWFFSGLILVVVLVCAAFYQSGRTKEKELAYLDKPQVGDIYWTNEKPGSYSTMKVSKVLKDSIYVLHNAMETNKIAGIYEIDIDKNYTTEYAFSKQQLKELYTKDEIYNVDRKSQKP